MSGYNSFFWGHEADEVNRQAQAAIKVALKNRLEVVDSGLFDVVLVPLLDGGEWPIAAEPMSTFGDRLKKEIEQYDLRVNTRRKYSRGYGRVIRAQS